MVHIILRAIARIKSDVAAQLQATVIEGLCRELGHSWRDRLLTPVVTIHAFLLQVLHGNTACDHVPHLVNGKFTGAAYCLARGRLPLALFERLIDAVTRSLSDCIDQAENWCGHRTWLIDGSSCSMPDTPELQQAFGQSGAQKPGCGFPTAHLLALFHGATGILQKVLLAPLRTHDMAGVSRLHPELSPGDVLVGDRGFCSYAHLAQLLVLGLFGVFRTHQKTIVDFRKGRIHIPPKPQGLLKGARGLPRSRWVRWLGRLDQVVEYYKPVQRPVWMTPEAYAALPASIMVRELRFKIKVPDFRTKEISLTTTLLDPVQYPAAELAQLYFDRWQVETNLRHLKQTLHLDVLRCKTLDGIRKEVCMIALAYNLVRLVMLEAAKRQRLQADRISFIDALRWLCNARPGQRLRKLTVHPIRHRVEPRVCKRRPKSYPLLNLPRQTLRKRLKNKTI